MSAFHPDALNVSNAPNFFGLKSQIGRTGWRVKGRTEGRTKESCEAYLARRLFLNLGQRRRLKYPLSIKHADAPDFLISEARREYALEVTEACASRDGQEMALSEGSDEEPVDVPISLGSFGGRGAGGFVGYQAEQMVIDDIAQAIRRKIAKTYTHGFPTDLLIYPNSNPMLCIHHAWQRTLIESARYERGTLRRIFVFWSDAQIVEI